MKDIKFRVWEPRHAVMLYPDVIQFFGEQVDRVWGSGYKFTSDSEPQMVPMQYTGLKDKNGKEIYEGDILRAVYPPSPKKDDRVVKFLDGSFCFNESQTRGKRGNWALSARKAKTFKVVGNIYENPELLK